MMPSLGGLDLLILAWALLVAWIAYKVDQTKEAQRTKAEESERFAKKFLGGDK